MLSEVLKKRAGREDVSSWWGGKGGTEEAASELGPCRLLDEEVREVGKALEAGGRHDGGQQEWTCVMNAENMVSPGAREQSPAAAARFSSCSL